MAPGEVFPILSWSNNSISCISLHEDCRWGYFPLRGIIFHSLFSPIPSGFTRYLTLSLGKLSEFSLLENIQLLNNQIFPPILIVTHIPMQQSVITLWVLVELQYKTV